MSYGSTISVVIPTFNRKELLRKNLESLSDQTLPPDKFEVIIISDGGTDDSEQMVKSFNARYGLTFHKQPHGEDVPYNVGGRLAKNDFIIFLDDDVIPHKRMLEAVINAHNRFDGPTAVIGRLQWPEEKKLTPFERYVGESGVLMGTHKIENKDDVHFQFALGGNFSVPRELFEKSGGFDIDLNIYGYIDIEFGYRLKKMYDARLIYEHEAAADHWCCSPFPRFCKQRELAGVTGVIFYTKHPELSEYLKIDFVRSKKLSILAFRTLIDLCCKFIEPFIPVLERLSPFKSFLHMSYRLCIFNHYQKGLLNYLNRIKNVNVPPYPPHN